MLIKNDMILNDSPVSPAVNDTAANHASNDVVAVAATSISMNNSLSNGSNKNGSVPNSSNNLNNHQEQCQSQKATNQSDSNSNAQDDSRNKTSSNQLSDSSISDESLKTESLKTSNGDNKLASDEDANITIIHFNDCYNIEPGPKSSGAAGFLTAINEHKHLNPMILFSGDILSPSYMSTFTKGEQMIPVLNSIGVHCAVFGNHEFDYGVDNLIDFTKKTSFPWLLSNVIDKETSNQLGDGQVYHILERSGIRFGLIGLIEEEWLSTLSTVDSSDVIYHDFVTKGQELARWLKDKPHNVDYVIALTHFRTPNDIRLSDSVPEIDLILGGHDHDYDIIKRENSYILKSGTDFREFSKITLKIDAEYMRMIQESPSSRPARKPFAQMDVQRIECCSYPPNEELKSKLEKFVTTIDEKMGKVLGQFNCELDGRFSSIRNYETNLGNFVTDIMLASTHADLAILNSGTLRSDRIHPKGDFTMRDLFNILGYIDPIAVLQASGRQIWRALENGVSQWPKLEGRFPQVSGCSFAFDPSKPASHRIDPKDIFIGDDQLDLDRQYKLTTKAYLASGKDGYDVLKECEILVPGDESPDLTTSILNHFEAISIVKSNRRTHHRQSIICMSRSSLKKILNLTENAAQNAPNQTLTHEPSFEITGTTKTNDPQTNGQNEVNNNSAVLEDSIREEENCDEFQESTNMRLPMTSSPSDAMADRLAHSTNSICAAASGGQLSISSPATPIPRTKRIMSVYEIETEQCKLEPKVEGRIRIITGS